MTGHGYGPGGISADLVVRRLMKLKINIIIRMVRSEMKVKVMIIMGLKLGVVLLFGLDMRI